MNPRNKAVAGTLESSDIFVEIAPGGGGVSLELESPVKEQFGRAIEAAARDVLAGLGVDDASLRLTDRGALDCTVRARVETAVRRAHA